VLVYPAYLALAEQNFTLNPKSSLSRKRRLRLSFKPKTTQYTWRMPWSISCTEKFQSAGGVARVRSRRHGYGLRRTALPVTAWPQALETWLHTINVLPGQ